MKLQVAMELAVLLCLAGCGTPGAPQPPSLELPRRVVDLTAARQGNRVTLRWSEPRQNTDGTLIKRPPATRVCRGVNRLAMLNCTVAGQVPAPARMPAAGQQESYTDILPPELEQQNATGFASYAVEVVSRRGRSAGLSNQVMVPLAPTLPPPSDLSGEVTATAIVLRWTGPTREQAAPAGLAFSYRVYRRTEGAEAALAVGDVPLAAASPAQFDDRNFDWEKTYEYRVTVVTAVTVLGRPAQVEGEESAPVTVVARDIFPPVAPAGLQAVASGVGQPPFIDLSWAPNTESDLAGYNVYRREAGTAAARINPGLVKTSSYRDGQVQPGRRYYYSVTAVDVRGNESAHSAEASEIVPP